MKFPSFKDAVLLFCVFVLTAAAAGVLFLTSPDKNIRYQPVNVQGEIAERAENIEETETTEKRTLPSGDGTVYITDSGKAFHIDKKCAGNPENIKTVTRFEAESMGKKPCGRCLKGAE